MQNLSFGFKRKHCIFVADFSEHFGNLAVFSAFNRNYSLTRCWEKFIGIKRSYRIILTIAKVKSFKPCLCKHKSIILTVQQLFKSGVNIAPYILEFCIRIDFLRKKKPDANASEKEKTEQNSWMIEGIGVGMLAGYWLGKVLGNAVLGLSLGVLLGMLLGSKIKKFK